MLGRLRIERYFRPTYFVVKRFSQPNVKIYRPLRCMNWAIFFFRTGRKSSGRDEAPQPRSRPARRPFPRCANCPLRQIDSARRSVLRRSFSHHPLGIGLWVHLVFAFGFNLPAPPRPSLVLQSLAVRVVSREPVGVNIRRYPTRKIAISKTFDLYNLPSNARFCRSLLRLAFPALFCLESNCD